jgi:hypothetical protein
MVNGRSMDRLAHRVASVWMSSRTVPACWASARSSFTDLEPEFLGRVEELIDFVTAPGSE